MTKLHGVFLLRTPHDMLDKLEADFIRFKEADPLESAAHYAAFDFFVTAEHLAEWQGRATDVSIASLRNYPDGAVVAHIASGAKHFTVSDPRHTSVKDTSIRLHARPQPDGFHTDALPVSRKLVVEREDGVNENALAIAERVLTHWNSVIK